METTFFGQPFMDGHDLRDFMTFLAGNEQLRRLDVVVAWAKRSGFRLITDQLGSLRARSVNIRFVVGISAGGATRQGLELVMEHADEAYVLHNAVRAFHPKMYAAFGDDAFWILIGSHNLTAGGAVLNYGVGTMLAGTVAKRADKVFADSVIEYIDRIIADHDVCIRLTEASLARIVNDPVYAVQDEDAIEGGGPGTTRNANLDRRGRLFGRSRYRLRGIGTPARGREPVGGRRAGRGFTSPVNTETTQRVPNYRWYKELKPSDAQRLGGNSNPTGHLTLVAAGLPVGSPLGFFHDEFFATAAWHVVDATYGREQAVVEFEVVIDGETVGTDRLTIDYNPRFESGQRNRMLTLRWGDRLNRYLHTEADRVGDYVTVEAFNDGYYRLTIDRQPVGDFIG